MPKPMLLRLYLERSLWSADGRCADGRLAALERARSLNGGSRLWRAAHAGAACERVRQRASRVDRAPAAAHGAGAALLLPLELLSLTA